ncbi:hypothetical protein B0T26DRAFT_773113 [Lasiosphaeria miniovina]|uniref:Uncharacterized protein n=1 Tax=Lasiosphaeria miniovina TaxID=1954250 RepID=A0AA40E5M6_9PEZI|nr:uncharacterized protein B0T26DRAFT_773113 [Lasiosphaeria miniovina]KAK0723363.1 hypothetical protein B0T26DRAFT_773113 [Lasiosphaeria miniovina]
MPSFLSFCFLHLSCLFAYSLFSISVSDLISHPTNKAWTQHFEPTQNLFRQTTADATGRNTEDDVLRGAQLAVHPNVRNWLQDTEADVELFFHTEVSNAVLAKWNGYPLVTQPSHARNPASGMAADEMVDAIYTVDVQNNVGTARTVITIGEMKRNIIAPRTWQNGNLYGNREQLRLSQELAPHVYCFDGDTLLLQLQAKRPSDIASVPGTGFRRLQRMYAVQGLTVGGFSVVDRRFFDSRPMWDDDGAKTFIQLASYERIVDPRTRCLKWRTPNDPTGVNDVWETWWFWN